MPDKHLLPSGYRWLSFEGERPLIVYHIVTVEHMYYRVGRHESALNWSQLPDRTECGKEIRPLMPVDYAYVSRSESQACPACWDMRGRY